LGPFLAWSIMMDVSPLASQVDRIEAADLMVRTEKMVLAPPSVPENEPVPLFAAPATRHSGSTEMGYDGGSVDLVLLG
jgi:hypothetical protein